MQQRIKNNPTLFKSIGLSSNKLFSIFWLTFKTNLPPLGILPNPIFKPGKYCQRSKRSFLQQRINNDATVLESVGLSSIKLYSTFWLNSKPIFNILGILPKPIFPPWKHFQRLKEVSCNKESTMIKPFNRDHIIPKMLEHCWYFVVRNLFWTFRHTFIS